MSYQQPNQPNYQYPGGQPQQAAMQPRPARPPADDLDAIPMQKTKPGLIIAIVAGVAVVIAVTAWSMSGKKKTSAKDIQQMQAQGAATGETLSVKDQQRFQAMAGVAEAKAAEEAKKEKAAADAKKAAEDEEKAKTEAAKAGGAAGPAPVSGTAAKKASSGLDSIGADYASKLGGN
jgi:hypothetical protein